MRPRPGESLDLLPDAELPADMEWARGAPHVAGAWARFAAAADAAGEDALPQDVRAWLGERLEAWNGEDPPLGQRRGSRRRWVSSTPAGAPRGGSR